MRALYIAFALAVGTQALAQTTPVIFEFTSPQFVIESGKAVLFRLTEGPSGGLTTMAWRGWELRRIS